MKTKLGEGNEEILKHLMPDNFAVGCRRPTPGNGYLEALTRENVRVITDGIEQVVPTGIRFNDSGETVSVDTIICATGFDLSFCPRFPLIGRDGESIHETWKDLPEAYLSTAVPGFPNYFSKTYYPPPPNRSITLYILLDFKNLTIRRQHPQCS